MRLMARYIDAEELLKEIKEEYGHLSMFDNEELFAVKMRLQTMPTADVVEVVHGEWLRQNGGFFFLCSNCGKAAATKGNFCHNCGAKMQ